MGLSSGDGPLAGRCQFLERGIDWRSLSAAASSRITSARSRRNSRMASARSFGVFGRPNLAMSTLILHPAVLDSRDEAAGRSKIAR